jgi:SAM-dependent methyltransferase
VSFSAADPERVMILRVVGRAGIDPLPAAHREHPDATVVEVNGAVLAHPGDALPFADASFDAAVAIHSLEAVPDRSWALTELRRTLKGDGRLVLAVWGPLEDNPALSALGDSLRRRGGVQAEAAVQWLSSLSEPDDLRALLRLTDFDHLQVIRQRGDVELSSAGDLRGWLLDRFPIGAAIRALPPEAREEVVSDVLGAFEGWALEGSAHRIPFTRDVHTATARRAA